MDPDWESCLRHWGFESLRPGSDLLSAIHMASHLDISLGAADNMS